MTEEEEKSYDRRQTAFTVIAIISLIFCVIVMLTAVEMIANSKDSQQDNGAKEVVTYDKPLTSRR